MYIYNEKTNEWVSHRDTEEYQARKRKVRDAWILFGLFMLFLPASVSILLGFFGIFATLTYLDEVEYTQELSFSRSF